MALSVEFYNTASNPKEVPKTLGAAITQTAVNCITYNPIDQLTGTLILDYNAALLNANYCTMAGKNYFITERKYGIGQHMELTLKVDVLETYWQEIKHCPAVFDRSDSHPNNMLSDPMERVSTQREVEYLPFVNVGVGNPFDYPDRILVQTML